MIYDYTFFLEHAKRNRIFKNSGVHSTIGSPLSDFFGNEREAHYEILFKPSDILDFETPSIVRCKGAYFKGGQSLAELEESLHTKLPEDFAQFYEQFGECVIFTRSVPVRIYPLKQMIDDFEDDPDIDIKEGRFFRFARYQDPLYLGLRQDDQTNEWQVVICTYGLLYSEMIGPQGRGNVVAPSFYVWLKHLIETDGYPDTIYPRDGNVPYLTVREE